MRYIDADNYKKDLIQLGFLPALVVDVLDKQPTTDVVEVVRCKDCEYCHTSIDPKTQISIQVCGYVGYNPAQSSQVECDDYCSHGERREG